MIEESPEFRQLPVGIYLYVIVTRSLTAGLFQGLEQEKHRILFQRLIVAWLILKISTQSRELQDLWTSEC